MLLVGWVAVRGSMTLATALSVPLLTTSGVPFPERDLVVFLAAATIVITLALNGIPLPWLIRKLRAPIDGNELPAEDVACVALAHAGIAAVQSVLAQRPDAEGREFAEQLIHPYRGKITLREGDSAAALLNAGHISSACGLRLASIQAERECLHRLHAQAVTNDEILRLMRRNSTSAKCSRRRIRRAARPSLTSTARCGARTSCHRMSAAARWSQHPPRR